MYCCDYLAINFLCSRCDTALLKKKKRAKVVPKSNKCSKIYIIFVPFTCVFGLSQEKWAQYFSASENDSSPWN